MIFFITGASSFVGVELCRYLSDNGHQVIAMTRRENERLNDIASGGHLKVFRADMQNLVEKAVNVRADVFMHLAWAGTSHEDRDNPAIHNENARLSLEYVKLAKRMGCKLYVDAGSQAEYGIVPGIITEETECHPFSAYGKAKLQMYQESRALTAKLGIKYIHLRILSVYGENDHETTLIKTCLRKLMNNEQIELRSGGQKWNYVYVKDAARQIAELSLHAIDDNALCCEVYNIASDDTRRLSEFVEVMKNICGSKSELRCGGYDKAKDVNLNPDVKKTKEIVNPLTEWIFEDVIDKLNTMTM
jgi:Nucleoside-diphosphate-sugar epimerases